jgi:hypothetical protein
VVVVGTTALIATTATASGPATPVTAAPVATLRAPVAAFVITEVKGDLAVPKPLVRNYAPPNAMDGFGCQNIVVTASSKAQKPKPPGYTGFWISQPMWTQTSHATGTFSSGHCSYAVGVRPGDAFNLSIGPSGSFQCTYLLMALANDPGYLTVPKGTVKSVNLAAGMIECMGSDDG